MGKLLMSLVATLGLMACIGQKNSADYHLGPLNSLGEPIISERFKSVEIRAEIVPKFVALIKLKLPPLLSDLPPGSNQQQVVDLALAESIDLEQGALIEKLKDISPDISVKFRYRLILNALAIEAPQSVSDQLNQLDFDFIEADERFSIPDATVAKVSRINGTVDLNKHNSMSFIGVDQIHRELKAPDGAGGLLPVKGQGVKVGIIDTGIDYTHAMLGGAGDPNQFAAIDPNAPAGALFPNQKIVGGYDFVGANFDTSSPDYQSQLPSPDPNPLDQDGHGTHVAGTVAGIGDGTNTYDGAAPGADLYALKVFGDNGGSTSDTVVIAALEYAADPNGDLDLSDKLDVVNLSLGGGYGKPHSLYTQAIANLVAGGTVVVASAGNAGPERNIVGAPSTADAAISVAASVDNMPQNIEFATVAFATPNSPKIVVEAVEGAITKPIIDGNVHGKLVYIGDATTDLSPDQLAALKDHVALIDRGGVPFVEKIERAKDAVGIVMVNNNDGPAIVMGGDKNFPIPGVMITKAAGDLIKAEIAKGDVTITFNVPDKISKPELIDTLTSFSSQGPRTLDSLIKPEISAPGLRIISAQAGSGNGGVQIGGTSMSSPHIAGVAALVRQYRPQLSASEIKAVLINTATLIDDAQGNIYPISRQGGGRVQAYLAATTPLIVSKPTLSLGEIQVETTKVLREKITIRNKSDSSQTLQLKGISGAEIAIRVSPDNIALAANGEAEVLVTVSLNGVDNNFSELDGFVEVTGQGITNRIPIMAVVNRLTRMTNDQLLIYAGHMDESSGAAVDLSINNMGLNSGIALPFNLLGKDSRKSADADRHKAIACDLQMAGYRTIEVDGRPLLQLGIKLYNPVTNFNTCYISVEIDGNEDGIADQELVGTAAASIPGLSQVGVAKMTSVLFDAKKLKTLQKNYTEAVATSPNHRPTADFTVAALATGTMLSFDHSTIAILETPIAALPLPASGELGLKISVSYVGDNAVEGTDALGGSAIFKKINLIGNAGGYSDLPEVIYVGGGQRVVAPLTKGENPQEKLVTFFPYNRFIKSFTGEDSQAMVVQPDFKFAEKPPQP